MMDQKTTIFGFLAAIAAAVAHFFPQTAYIAGPLSNVFTALLGYHAADRRTN